MGGSRHPSDPHCARVIDAFFIGHIVRQHRVRPYATRAMHQVQDFIHRHGHNPRLGVIRLTRHLSGDLSVEIS